MALDSVRHVVLVLSGKGGVGKSSVTTQLALSLSLKGHNVGILDVDLTGPSIPRFLGIEDSKVKQAPGGWIPVQVHEAQSLRPAPLPTFPVERDESTDSNPTTPEATTVGSIYAMSLAFLLADRGTAIVWRGPKKTAMVRQFLSTTKWPDVDYLLIDTPPGTSDEHISLVEMLLKDIGGSDLREAGKPQLSGAVIVTTPQAVSVSDVRKELNFCAKTGLKVIGVVENMSGYVCPCCGEEANLFSKGGGQVMAAEFGVPFLGNVPVDPLWGILVEEGKRPRYNDVVANELARKADEVEGDEADEAEADEGKAKEDGAAERKPAKEEGLLVDKYRNCSLFPAFAKIAGEVVARTE